jgi:glycosyltransferase involved in cell wall biosynthesis
MDQRPFVSVVIPVFNGSEYLRTCLEALERQTYPKHFFEVIVVDNNSKDGIGPLVGQFERARLGHEKAPGSYGARNVGISLAKGEVFAFTDADCIPARDWIEKGVEALYAQPDCGLVAGRVEFFFKRPGKPSMVEFYDSLTFLQQKKFIERSHFGATANLFTFRRIFDEVGLFDTTISSGDVKWGNLVHKKGHRLIYAETACVRHPARDSFSKIREKIIRVVGGHHSIYKWHKESLSDFLARSVKDLARNYRTVIGVFKDERIKGMKQKGMFLTMLVLHKWIGACERVRLRCGGKPRRG